MNGFSASDAALEGFRLTRERLGTVFIWALIYAAAMAAIGEIMFASLGTEAMAVARKGQLSADDMELLAGKLVHSLPAFLLVLLLAVGLMSVITAGIYRMILRPQERSFASLRLGGDELRLTIANVLLFAVGIVCVFLGAVALAFAEQGNPLLGAVLGTAVLVFTAWVGVRLSLATPMTFATRRLAIGQSWALSRGRFWPLFGMILLAVIFYIMVWLLIMIIWYAVIMLAGGQEAISAGERPVAIAAGVAAFLIQMVISVIQIIMIYAPLAVAYEQIHGDPSVDPLRAHPEHG